jgi:hypothetical protein
MSKKHKHHVKSHHWHKGVLKTIEHFFDSLEDAMIHAKSSDANSIKVYNESGELVHTSANNTDTAYA